MKKQVVLVTGGCGFIGSHFIRIMINETDYDVVNIDKMTYAARHENLYDISMLNRYTFRQADISNFSLMEMCFDIYQPDFVVNFAAETHVDRSIDNPDEFLETNVVGLNNLLNLSRNNIKRFIHVSTDEVYGASKGEMFLEDSQLNPRNPYSASKAAGDMLVSSYINTYDLPALITRASNTYGPGQYPEKIVPLAIMNVLAGRPIPLYGDGQHKREWTYVRDHARAILLVMEKGECGEIYNVSANYPLQNQKLAETIIFTMQKMMGLSVSGAIEYVDDRPGHDRSYSVDSTKIRDLGWKPMTPFTIGLVEAIKWYKNYSHIY